MSKRTLVALKVLVWILCLAPIAIWVYQGFHAQLGANPVDRIQNQTGLVTIRLVVPWKYGFKGIKSIVKINLVEKEPRTTWNESAPNEYGFYSNVNPHVDHPRWSQAKERRIGDFFRRDTLMFNGYGEQVASLYNGMDLKKYY